MSRDAEIVVRELATGTVSGGNEIPPEALEDVLQWEGTEELLPGSLKDDGAPKEILWTGIILLAILLAVLAAGVAAIVLKRKRGKTMPNTSMGGGESQTITRLPQEAPAQAAPRAVPAVTAVGKVHHIGRRQAQQDSLGVTSYGEGLLAVVADGMGGLSDGDKVSQRIVLTMLQDSVSLAGNKVDGALYRMLAHANREVNSMLGPAEQYKSGSTVVAVMVEAGGFQWISVGDSRIYLYRGHHLMQINREHVHEADLWKRAVNGGLSFSEIAADPQRKHVSSFIGMGELRHIDGSIRPARIYPGDKLLLMSDGVFNTLSEQEICDVLMQEGEAQRAAKVLEEMVLARQNPKQDNFTAVILDI